MLLVVATLLDASVLGCAPVVPVATLLKAAKAYWNAVWACSAVPDASDCEPDTPLTAWLDVPAATTFARLPESIFATRLGFTTG